MAAGQWEVVTRSKKDKNLTKAEKKKLIDNAPKVEDILPMAQVQSLYSNLSNNKENKKPKEQPLKPNPTQASQQKKANAKKKPEAKKPELPPKPKITTIDGVFEILEIKELQSVWDLGKQRFPQTPVVWLKDLAIFINSRTNQIENVDPIFYNKSLSYPTSILPKAIAEYFEECVTEMGIKTLQNFYETCLSSIPFNLSRGDSVVGYKLFIQLVLKHHPIIVLNCKHSFNELKKSYQNNPQIGLSLLWCVNQAMYKDFDIALRVFRELMFEMIEMKHYSKYIIGCLKTLLSRKWETGALSFDYYIYLFNLVNNITKLNIAPNIRKPLEQCDKNLESLVFDNRIKGEYDKLFETVMTNLQANQYTNNASNQLLEVLRRCFIRDIKCIEIWKQLYQDNINVSAKLLTLINQKWGPKAVRKINQKQFKALLLHFDSVNNSVSPKNSKTKNPELPVQEISRVIKILLDKMTTKKSFPWKRYIILFIIIPISLLIAYDCTIHNGFENSTTKHYLKETGALEHGTVVLKQLIKMSKQSNQWMQANGPGYYERAAKFLLPYIELCGKLFLILVNMFSRISEYWFEKQPMVLEFIESYAPGLLDSVLEMVRLIIEFLSKWRHIVADYLATKIFIGELSPENLQKATLAAFNTSQNIAIRYYHWFNQIITKIEQS